MIQSVNITVGNADQLIEGMAAVAVAVIVCCGFDHAVLLFVINKRQVRLVTAILQSAGVDKQPSAAFRHAQITGVAGFLGICSTQRSSAETVPVLGILDNTKDLRAVVVRIVVLSKEQEVILCPRVKAAEYRELL